MLGHIHIATLCWTLFMEGWNDGSTGPLLPRIQRVYNVSYIVVSLLFVAGCVGIMIGGAACIFLTARMGFGKVGSLVQATAYCIQSPAPPFVVFALAFGLSGFGMALQDGQANGYVAGVKNSSTKLGFIHCAYGERPPSNAHSDYRSNVFTYLAGAGALVAPLASTQFAQLEHWSFQYLISLSLCLLNTVLLIAVFRFKSQDECFKSIGEAVGEHGTSKDNTYKQIFKQKAVHLLSLFILAYVGVEVTIGGWIVTYIIRFRDGGPSSGYISSGFFGGLALGRIALLWVNQKLGQRLAVLIYMLLAIGLELIVWLVPSLISGAVAISLTGFFMGPIYPIVMNETARILPRWLLTGSISWIAAFGTTGAAALPFIAGALAQEKGIWTLQPLLLAMMAVMVSLWLIIPKERVSDHAE
ncbi:hypothetical protein HETIRDRAFT_417929 [Heterobasidion irregulare TC 32-1]|uniref:Major facilitator superfamily (MFS) profile domain-containing protein n=1 Tax=Heterobasidion irregulare (strain TC 32-1) TaxID=747525 RepID=W4K7W4_HETIT|nr:uncharacterized protein HETIRDRAFT_417929 [Heterobasidion irregulare TC 32-1]ETW81878.1 hypothetical protein HETIRDRAFT_417929 [Heterobasidion irregulare TC 32-1]